MSGWEHRDQEVPDSYTCWMSEFVAFAEGSPLRMQVGFIKKKMNAIYSGPFDWKLIDPFGVCPGYQQLLYAGGTDDILEPFRDGKNWLTGCECSSQLY